MPFKKSSAYPGRRKQQQAQPAPAYPAPPAAAAAPQAYVPHAQPIGTAYAPAAAATPQAYVPSAPPQPSAPPLEPSSSSSSEYWTCVRCTFVNFRAEARCKACNGEAPPSASGPPQPQVTQHHQPAQAYQPQPQPQQQKTMQWMMVPIPPGMKPGQQVGVKTGANSTDVVTVTIPARSQWKTQPGQPAPFFHVQVPAAEPARPVVVQGKAVGRPSPQAAHATSGAEPAAQQPWQPWDRFSSRPRQPVPLGMQPVPHAPPGSLSNVHASGRRRALLIGINYRGTRAALRGCVNDARNMKQLLLQHGYRDDSSHMVMLIDEGNRDRSTIPTRENILRGLQWLVHGASEGDVLFFHFSGHGAQVPDKSGHEADGFNETILPVDYKKGQITDDVLWEMVVYPLPSGVRLTAVMDCCHSGTGLDLPYECRINTGQWIEDVNPAHSRGDVLLFSGCEDSQTSADAFDLYQAGGAMTQSFIRAYREMPLSTFPDFMAAIHRHLRNRGFRQRPQLTASQRFDVRSRVFSFTDGIEPNHNPEIGRMKRRHVRPAKAGYKNSGIDNLLFGAGAFAAGMFLADALF